MKIELRNFHNMQKQQSPYSLDYFPVVLCIGTTNLTVCQYGGFSMQSTFIVRRLGTLSPIITFFEADSERNLYGGGKKLWKDLPIWKKTNHRGPPSA
jgi:hypothetical protein